MAHCLGARAGRARVGRGGTEVSRFNGGVRRGGGGACECTGGPRGPEANGHAAACHGGCASARAQRRTGEGVERADVWPMGQKEWFKNKSRKGPGQNHFL